MRQERSWTVGSSADCDIRVESDVVSSRHCRLTQRGESYLLEDLGSSNGTFVAGERIGHPRIVWRGDPVTLGRHTPLPWPPTTSAITIGRAPDNDFVIPLDMVSAYHARLERKDNELTLVDLQSSNGTAINDIWNKIASAPIDPTDHVFFGTHRVAAVELIRALPLPRIDQKTVLEADSQIAANRQAVDIDRSGQTADWLEALLRNFQSRSNWAWGLLFSVLCGLVVLSMPPAIRSDTSESTGTESIDDSVSSVNSSSGAPQPETSDSTPTKAFQVPETPSQTKVGNSKDALAMLGLRIDDNVVVTSATAWACRPDAIICVTPTLKLLEQNLAKDSDRDESLVVCSRDKTIAILSHVTGLGDAAGLSIAKLEAPLPVTCQVAARPMSWQPGQRVAMLSAKCVQYDPRTMNPQFTLLTIDRIERDDDSKPRLLHCSTDRPIEDGFVGAPVFAADGSVVGCVVQAAAGVKVLPATCFAELVQ